MWMDLTERATRARAYFDLSNEPMTALYGRLPEGKGVFRVGPNKYRLQFYIRPVVQTEACGPDGFR
jgi:hypothetical protein